MGPMFPRREEEDRFPGKADPPDPLAEGPPFWRPLPGVGRPERPSVAAYSMCLGADFQDMHPPLTTEWGGLTHTRRGRGGGTPAGSHPGSPSGGEKWGYTGQAGCRNH